MFSDLKNFLICNKNERTGIFILISMILTVIMLEKLSLFPAKTAINDPLLIARLDSILKQDSISRYRQDSLFFFDPNQIDKNSWMLLGLSERQAEVVVNYKKAGGKFYSKEDVQKLYTVDDEMYRKLEPYILIMQDTTPLKRPVQKKAHDVWIELNSADSSRLTSLHGIGPVFASRIISYRNLLGGYLSIEQLLEVYGMDSSRMAGFVDKILIDTSGIKKIHILSAEFRKVLRHPYISYELTRFIFNNREDIKENGIETLFKFDQMNDSIFRKITPYLSLE